MRVCVFRHTKLYGGARVGPGGKVSFSRGLLFAARRILALGDCSQGRGYIRSFPQVGIETKKKIELKLHKIGVRSQLAPCSTSPVHKFNDISSLFLFFSRRPYLRGSFYYLPVDTVVLLVMRWGLISSLIFPLAAASVETELCAPQPSIYTSLSLFSLPDNKTSSSSEMECDCPG